MSEELKPLLPCPFCGANSDIAPLRTEYGLWLVQCDNCEANGPTSAQSKTEAIAAWDRREWGDRNAVIEECARMCEPFFRDKQAGSTAVTIRDCIRALKATP